MKRNSLLLALLAILSAMVACTDYETYGDKKEKERDAISDFIAYKNISVISEDQFNAQNNTTDVSKNEYVYLNNSGVYMQIVRKGCGKEIQDGENTNLLVRFIEQSIFDTTAIVTNWQEPYDPDVMNITRATANYTASLKAGTMYSAYGSYSVPAGWLVPFPYIKVGRDKNPDDEISKVRLIVPHTQGHTVAANNVAPYFYTMTFERIVDID